jgi:hypothetical protein
MRTRQACLSASTGPAFTKRSCDKKSSTALIATTRQCYCERRPETPRRAETRGNLGGIHRDPTATNDHIIEALRDHRALTLASMNIEAKRFSR